MEFQPAGCWLEGLISALTLPDSLPLASSDKQQPLAEDPFLHPHLWLSGVGVEKLAFRPK